MLKFSKVTVEFGGSEKLETVEASNGAVIQRLTTWNESWGKKSNVQKGNWSIDGVGSFADLKSAKASVMADLRSAMHADS